MRMARLSTPHPATAAFIPRAHYAGGSMTGTGAAIGAGMAVSDEDLTIKIPGKNQPGNLLPIKIIGLDLRGGESARVYVNDCEVLEITNYGDIMLRDISTRIRMTKFNTDTARIRVESEGRNINSKPIKLQPNAMPCEPMLGFNASSDYIFYDHIDSIKTDKKSIRLSAKPFEDTVKLQMRLSHPMLAGQVASQHNKVIPPRYITHIGLMLNRSEIIAIKTSPYLANNPQIDLTLESISEEDKISVLWRDNSNRLAKNLLAIKFE